MQFFNPKIVNSMEKLAQSPYAGFFELLHTGIALMSAEGNFLYSNKAFIKLFNLPVDIIGKHVSDFFLTAEQGVMSAIRDRKMVVCSSLTTTNAEGISFRYPLMNDQAELLGIILESIPSTFGETTLSDLMSSVREIEQSTSYLEQKANRKHGMLHTFDSIIGESKAILEMKRYGRRFARSKEPVLVIGESGTGKELVAQALHSASPRAKNPFIVVNSAALPRELMESELFGYEGGAFTGARAGGVVGKFEQADTGTIFLDEIGELPLPVQAKLLRVLESGEIQKIAHRGTLHSDFRLIAATNRDLNHYVEEGRFRADLYHRLNIFELKVPPLRDRISDIPLLARRFIETEVGRKRSTEIRISSETYRAFSQYPWQGNVRELKNVLTYALYALEDNDNVLSLEHLPPRFLRTLELAMERDEEAPLVEMQNLAQANAQAERKTLVNMLEKMRYNKTLTARALGISRNKLYHKLHEYGLLEGLADSKEE